MLSQENEKKKKKLRIMDDVQYLWDGGMVCCFFWGVSGTQEDEKDDKGSVPFTGSGIKNIPTLSCVLPGPLYDVITLPSCWSCSGFGSRPQHSGLGVPPATDLGSVSALRASNLTSKGNVHI